MAGETKSPSPEKGAKGEFVRFLGVASTIGINFVVSTLTGIAIGYLILDRIFNTFPWFTVIFMVLGIAAGFMYLFRIAAKAGRYDDNDSGRS